MHKERDSRKQTLVTVGVVSAIVLVVAVCGALIGALLNPSSGGRPANTGLSAPPAAQTGAIATEPTRSASATYAPAPVEPAPRASGIVVIDAGHQGKGDSSLEPVGPGASEKKAKVSGGASGTATGNPEGLVNLEVALKLRDELEKAGITVIMVREKQDVNISNSERAAIANRAGADLFIRLHCDGNASSSMTGLSTLIPAKNQWTGPILVESGKAGRLIHQTVIAATGARDRGVVERSDLSGFNWSKVPTVLVEMGFLSNAAEDRKLGSADYQEKLAKGMAEGITEYLKTK